MFRFVWRLMFSFGRFWVSSSRFTTWPFTFIRNTYQKTFYLWNQTFLSSLGCHLQLDCSSSVSSMTRESHAKNSVSTKHLNGQIRDRSGFPWFQSRKRSDCAIIWSSLTNLDQLWTDMIPFFGQSRLTSPTLLKLYPISAII